LVDATMKTVLIVEDNLTLSDFTARGLADRLDDQDVEIVCALSCENARRVAERNEPCVAVIDKRLPDGSGVELARELAERFPSCKTILVSADPFEHPVRRAHAMLTKPFEISELHFLVKQLIEGAEPSPCSAGAVPTPTKTARRLDTHLIKNRLSGLLAGLRAFGYDLQADAEDPSSVREAVDFYVDRLCTSVREICDLLEGQARR
jgi:DNA-binding response OmpR family regulator